MKKFFAVVAVATLSLGAVSCGEKKAEQAVEENLDTLKAEVDTLKNESRLESPVPVDHVEVAPAPTTEAPAPEAHTEAPAPAAH